VSMVCEHMCVGIRVVGLFRREGARKHLLAIPRGLQEARSEQTTSLTEKILLEGFLGVIGSVDGTYSATSVPADALISTVCT